MIFLDGCSVPSINQANERYSEYVHSNKKAKQKVYSREKAKFSTGFQSIVKRRC